MDSSKTSFTLDESLYDSTLDNFSLDPSEKYEPNSVQNKPTPNKYNPRNDLKEIDDVFNNLEVDPKSNLANKTIFKTDNPNLSIIEINNDNSTKLEEESVYLIELDDNDEKEHSDKFRSILQHSSQQKLNVSNNNQNKFYNHPSTSSSLGATTSSSSSSAKSLLESRKPNKPEKRIIKIYDTIDEFENNLPETVKILSTPYGSKVYLVGTAHFSEESQDDVSFVIRNVKPDIVVVELCSSRIHILKHDEQALLEEAKNLNFAKIRDIIRTNGVLNGIFFILLLHMNAKLTEDIGMAPGGEFRRAFDEVKKLENCYLHLGDRPINITLQRALRALSLWQTIKLVWRLSSTESIKIEEVEECKQQGLLEKILQEMAGEFPAFSDVFVHERDTFLCQSLQSASLPIIQPNGFHRPVKVVGIVGIGHTSGIVKKWLKVDINKMSTLLEIPPPRLSTQIIKYTFKFGFYSIIAYGIIKYFRPKFVKITSLLK